MGAKGQLRPTSRAASRDPAPKLGESRPPSLLVALPASVVGFGRVADGPPSARPRGANRVPRPLEVRYPDVELVAARRRDNGQRKRRSAASFAPSAPSCSPAGILTLNWIKRIRRQIACSSPRIVALVVGHQPQLELRNELKELAVQEPGADRVAAGQRLEPGFGKALPILGLDGADHARAREPRHVVVDV